jgi:hypothetical protein
MKKNSNDLATYLAFQASVQGNTITSRDFPVGSLLFDPALTYAGSQSFILYNVARCEIHLFIEADEQGQFKRLYWVQYEGYLPDHLLPERQDESRDYRYDYSGDPDRTDIGGQTFYDSSHYYHLAISEADLAKEDSPEDSDSLHVFRLLARAGYTIDAEVMFIRLVHLDPSRKKELMVIYIEALAQHGLSIDAFGEDGEKSEQWQAAKQELRARALAGMEMTFA